MRGVLQMFGEEKNNFSQKISDLAMLAWTTGDSSGQIEPALMSLFFNC